MKILHTGDWHLGKRLDNFSRLEEQREVLAELCVLADEHQADAIIIAGDLFDNFNPAVEALELLYRTLRTLSQNGRRPVIAIAGNHDSPDRIDAPDIIARECGIIFVGYPKAHIKPYVIPSGFSVTNSAPGFLEIQLPDIPYPMRVLHTPYANELRLKQYLGLEGKEQKLNELLKAHWTELADQYCDVSGVNLLTTHLYVSQRGGELLEEPEGEKPIKIGNAELIYSDCIPEQIQYTALGHLHRYQRIGGHRSPVVYPSSPLAYSFSEAGQKKGIVMVELSPQTDAQFTFVPLESGRNLQRKRFEDIEETISWLRSNPYALVELTLVSDEFINSADLKRIHEAHDGIIHIIPVIRSQTPTNTTNKMVNLEQDLDVLFKDYFQYKYAQQPNAEIMDLLKEVINNNTNTED
ncbi:MAG: metallophosphoesterase family protein [Sphingobacterium sp.]|uniref:metallophosphoesterase family protein n=1 Tax=Sphingobacterium sp. JB170 TaxID=1434842 RepID=UPI00097EA34A|nr:exonuclease subunit SbcD [Sphingobacterium sp. JB170]SJN45325.1 Exonuclease SbcD [Sphingobacterium sp. JB170]